METLMPEKFEVALKVTLIVHGDDPKDAMRRAKEWLNQVVKIATAHASNSPVLDPRVRSAVPEEQDEVLLYSESEKRQEKQEQEYEERERTRLRQARRDGGQERLALLEQLITADRIEDYLAAEAPVIQWLRQHNEYYGTGLSSLGSLLGTFKSAIRWSEEHPNSPARWNLSMLLTEIKACIQKELNETRSALQDTA